VENNADMNGTDNDGRNAVFIGIYEKKLYLKFNFYYLKKTACSRSHLNIVEYLIKHGLNVNQKDNYDCTPLMLGI